ncbi:MAG: thioredoxin domain-containing protein, partial [Anaerolinea sp.]|nr:thioredoxin domain-containing protein [Anaerolinea sp.]
SEGEEGKFFVWSPDELAEQLGPDARIAIEYWGVTPRGNFEGHNILYVPNDEAVIAQRLGLSTAELRAKIEVIRDTLYAARTRREPPGLDDKILAGWNGLMLASLAEAARVLDKPVYLDTAVHTGEFLRDHLITYEGHVFRTWKAGMARVKGFLEDYAALADAFLELYQTTFDVQWFTLARRLADRALTLFRAEDGGFHDTSPDHETLISRPRSLQDNAVPSGSALMARALIKLAAYTGEAHYDEAARASLGLIVNAMREYPQAFGEALSAVTMLVSGIDEIALIGPSDSEGLRALLAVLRQAYRPNQVVACAPAASDTHPVPLLRGRDMLNGQPTAYVCRQFACQLPVTTPEALAAQISGADAQARI